MKRVGHGRGVAPNRTRKARPFDHVEMIGHRPIKGSRRLVLTDCPHRLPRRKASYSLDHLSLNHRLNCLTLDGCKPIRDNCELTSTLSLVDTIHSSSPFTMAPTPPL